MTIMEASREWGYAYSTIFNYIKQGRIPGVEKRIQREKKRWEWFIPDDAQKPQRRAMPPRREWRTQARKHQATKNLSVNRSVMTDYDIADFIASHAGTMTYSELSQALGLPSLRIREIYDAMHDAYGV